MEGLISTFHIDTKLILAQLLNFAIVFAVLYIYAFKPLGKLMKERQGEIEQGLADAQASKEALQNAEEKVQELIKQAKAEANNLLTEAKRKQELVIQEAESKAKEQANLILAKAQEQAQEEKKQAEQEVYAKTAHLVSLGVAKILEEDIDDEKNEHIIQRALDVFKQS